MVSGLNQRELAVILSLRGNFNKELQSSERGLLRFRSELRRASIQFGALAAGGILALRQWTRTAEDNRASIQLISSAITSAGGNAALVTPKLEAMFSALSEKSGMKIGDVRDIWLELFRELGNADLATQLAPAATALAAITGQAGSAELLAKALRGDEGAVEQFRIMSGIDLAPFNTEAERLDAILTGGLTSRISEAVSPTDGFALAMERLKTALGTEAQKAFEGPLNILATVFERFAENEALVTFAATFTAIGTALLFLGTALAGILWLTATHPVILGLIALVATISALVAAYKTLDALFGGDKKGNENDQRVPGSTQFDGESLEHAAGRHVLNLQKSMASVPAGGLVDWLDWAMRDTMAKFPGLTKEQLTGSFEWQTLIDLIRKRLSDAGLVEGPALPLPAPGSGGGFGPPAPEPNITIYSNGDLDWERRVRELTERQAGIGYRGVV